MIKCSVVILNWNGEELLKKFLPGVIANSVSEYCEVVVVDNGSSDDSVRWIKSNHPDIKLICLDKNYGFTGGYNLAISQLNSEYSIILNSDIEIKDRWVEPLLEMLDNNSDVAAVMPKVLSQTRPEYFEYAGACGGYIDKFGFPFCRGRIISTVEKDEGQYDMPTEIFWATGAAVAIRNDLFRASGGFDEDYFAHMEEVDMCWRLKNMGYRIMVEPKSVVYHVGGATLSYSSPRKLFLNYRNSLYTIHKNTLGDNYKAVVFLRMLIDGFLAMIYLLTLKPKSFMAVINAHNEYRRNKAILDGKRLANLAMSSSQTTTGIYKRSIIISYMFGKKRYSKL